MAREIFTVQFKQPESANRDGWLDEDNFDDTPTPALQTGGLDIDVDLTDVTLDSASSMGYDSLRDTTRGIISRTPTTEQIDRRHILTQGSRTWEILSVSKDDHNITLILREVVDVSP